MMKATLSLTHKCNLACRYCYAGKANKPDISLETALKSVDYVMGLPHDGHVIDFGFFGGEPLIRFDLIKPIIAYIQKKSDQLKKAVSFTITTNGTLLTLEMLDYIRAKQIDLCVSLDGPKKVHDRDRIYHNGRGSFQDVYAKLQMALEQLDRVQINSVYGPETAEFMPDILDFFLSLKLPAVHFNPNICASWPDTIGNKLEDVFGQIAERYIDCYRYGQELSINFIDFKLILFMKDGYSPGDLCGMGSTEWGFAPSGNIYPCERFIGEDNDLTLCLGNVYHGIDPVKRCQILSQRGNRNLECRSCQLKQYCMNWCGCTNYFQTGYTDITGPMICAIEHAAIKSAEKVFTTLTREENELFLDHLIRYATIHKKYRII